MENQNSIVKTLKEEVKGQADKDVAQAVSEYYIINNVFLTNLGQASYINFQPFKVQ